MKRTTIEALHLLLGVAGALGIGALCAYAVPQVREEIWTVTAGVVVAVIFMGIRPLRLAMRADRDAVNSDR